MFDDPLPLASLLLDSRAAFDVSLLVTCAEATVDEMGLAGVTTCFSDGIDVDASELDAVAVSADPEDGVWTKGGAWSSLL